MSDTMETSSEPTGTETVDQTTDAADETATPDPAEELQKWRALARKHERDAKANRSAAAKLAKIEESQKTAEQRAADALAQAEARAAEAEARNLRSDIALDYGLTRTDADLLAGITDEDQMRLLAKRLADGAKGSKEPEKSETADRAVRRKSPRMTGAKTQDDQSRSVAKALFSGS